MAKQWTKEEKIKFLSESKGLSVRQAGKKFGISYSTINRWRIEVEKFGTESLEPGKGKQAKYKNKEFKSIKGKYYSQMSKKELIEELEKSNHLDLLSKSMKPKKSYKKIKEVNEKFGISISILCKISKTSKSGYYLWLSKNCPTNNKWDFEIEKLVSKYYYKFNCVYGYKMLTILINKFENTSFKPWVIYRYMRNMWIKCITRRKRHKYNLQSQNLVYPNLLDRNFKAKYYGEKLVTDITYLHYDTGNLYLSIVRDLFSGAILDHQISKQITFDFVELNLKNAFSKIPRNIRTLIHSDQGWHYTGEKYKEICEANNIQISMSRRGNSIDNAACETFFSSLKNEIVYTKSRNKWKKYELYKAVNDYINFYNNFRPLQRNKNMPPIEYIRMHI